MTLKQGGTQNRIVRPRIAIYGRHSTDHQNPKSSADQATECLRLVKQLRGILVDTYLDPAESGYRRDRPEFQRLLHDMSQGRFDIVIAEAIDRMGRDPEDLYFLSKKLAYHDVQLRTLSEGIVEDVNIGVAALQNGMNQPAHVFKTRRGQKKSLEAGRWPGCLVYGHRIVLRDEAGRLVHGLREIDPEQAAVVLRIYREFAGGRSAIRIAANLNADGIPSPRGKHWNSAVIRGNPKKLTGILNNPAYIGQLIWNRSQWRKNPDTFERKKTQKLNPKSEWLQIEVPQLRIIDDNLWSDVQRELVKRQNPKITKALSGGNRKKHLLSGLIKCGLCGANYVLITSEYYRCASAAHRGMCSNNKSLRKKTIEEAVLKMLQDGLLTTESATAFCDAYSAETKHISDSSRKAMASAKARLKKLDQELKTLGNNFLAGVASTTLQEMFAEREIEKIHLQAQLQDLSQKCSPPHIPPPADLVARYEAKVHTLQQALDDPCVRTDAAELMGELIECVTVYPERENGQDVEINAETALLASYATSDSSVHSKRDLRRSTAVVAGAGFEPATFRL